MSREILLNDSHHLDNGMDSSSNNFSSFSDIYRDCFLKWNDFLIKYNKALVESSSKSYKSMHDKEVKIDDFKNIRTNVTQKFNSTLESRLCEENISSSLADFVDSWLTLVKKSGYDKYHINYADFVSAWTRSFEPIRNKQNRTPSEVIKIKGKFNLHHYKTDGEKKHKTPLLVVYSLINRHYILDLLPQASVINNLRQQGFEIFATDWGTPDFYDKDLTLDHFAHDYVGNAVDKIKEITGADKVSLFGYCWGGIFTLIYSAIHPENVKNLVLHATPIDMSQERVVVENWTAHLDADKLVNTLGNVPGWFVNMAFILRNPVEPFLKYLIFFSEPKKFEDIQKFFGIETWLYDSRPIIGETYREIVNKICKNNLLIKNQMKMDGRIIDLNQITMPVLNIYGKYDDIVPPQSSKPITSVVGSKDKKLIEFPTGHVGLCISKKAHKQLWPEVGNWLAQRS